MSFSNSTHVFKYGLHTPPVTNDLEQLVLWQLDQAAQRLQVATNGTFATSHIRPEACSASTKDTAALVNEMGDYLVRTAMIWASLIEGLIQGPHIDHITLQILERSRETTRVADLSATASMDVTLDRLRKMRDLAAQYSREIQAVWKAGGNRRMSMSYSGAPRTPFSSHDETPSAAPFVTSSATSLATSLATLPELQSVPGASDMASYPYAPRRRKQMPDAAFMPREGLVASERHRPNAPLPPLPLLPPTSSLLLPPILPPMTEEEEEAARRPPKRPMTRVALKRAADARPLLISTPMVTPPMPRMPTISETPTVATSESVATPPISVASPTPAEESPCSEDTPEQEESDDWSDENQFAGINMNALRQRGKGKYYCPRGLQCDKGGVDKHGNLILFDRNSSFAQHCNKHRKPWRCDVPGCPNPPKKRRFARRDGLERHKATVKHYFMTQV